MRSIQSRLVNQTILMVNRTFSIHQIVFDSIQSIQSRVNQTPVWTELNELNELNELSELIIQAELTEMKSVL